MADRFPLIANSSSNQIQELASGDTLDLTGNSVTGAGIITATTFSGALSGSATGLSGTPEITVSTITGVAATFSGAVSIGGTLTYEDVTNVDSIGVITARSGVHFGTQAAGTLVTGNATGIGIGAATPTAGIQLGDTQATSGIQFGTGADFTIKREAGSAGVVFDVGSDLNNYQIDVGGSEKVRITSGGDVGIGTDSPGSKLEVNNESSILVATFNSYAAAGPLINIERNGTAIGFLGSGENLVASTGSKDALSIRSQAEFSVATGGGNERLRITSDGDVGIGTTVPDTTLTVNGTARMTIVDLGTVTGNVVLNFSNSNNFKLTMGGNLTFGAPTGITTGQSGVITLVQDGTGSRTASWDGAYMFKSGTAPTLSTGVGKTDCIAYYCFEPPYIVAGTFIGIGTQ